MIWDCKIKLCFCICKKFFGKINIFCQRNHEANTRKTTKNIV